MQIADTMVPLGEGVELEVRRIQHPDPQGPVLVFLHESLGSIDLWRRFPEQLARATGCDALIYNRQGYGRSTDEILPRPYDYQEKEGAVWLPRLLDKLDIEKVVLIGHSDGASIALIAAGAMGSRVQGLITMAGHHTYADYLTVAGIKEMTDIAAAIGDSAREVFLEGTGHSPHLEKPEQLRDLVCDFLAEMTNNNKGRLAHE